MRFFKKLQSAVFVLRRHRQIFENLTLIARHREDFPGSLAIFLWLNSIPEGVLVHKNLLNSCLSDGVVTAPSHANRDKSSNCDTYVKCVDVRCCL